MAEFHPPVRQEDSASVVPADSDHITVLGPDNAPLYEGPVQPTEAREDSDSMWFNGSLPAEDEDEATHPTLRDRARQAFGSLATLSSDKAVEEEVEAFGTDTESAPVAPVLFDRALDEGDDVEEEAEVQALTVAPAFTADQIQGEPLMVPAVAPPEIQKVPVQRAPTLLERKRAEREIRRATRVEMAAQAENNRQLQLHWRNTVELPTQIRGTVERITEQRRFIDPIATHDLERLPIFDSLSRRTRHLVVRHLEGATGIGLTHDQGGAGIERAQNEVLFTQALKEQQTKSKINLSQELDVSKREHTLERAAGAVSATLDQARQAVLPDVYVNPSPEGTTHREFAFREIVEAFGLNPDEWEITVQHRELQLKSRIVLGPNGRYAFDAKVDGIQRVLSSSSENLVENVIPDGTDGRVSALLDKKLTDGKYQGGFAMEVRYAGSNMEEPTTEEEAKSPSFVGVFTVEPVHVTAETYAYLMSEKTRSIGISGIPKVIKPTRLAIEIAQQTRGKALPEYTRYADSMRRATNSSQAAFFESLKADGLAEGAVAAIEQGSGS